VKLPTVSAIAEPATRVQAGDGRGGDRPAGGLLDDPDEPGAGEARDGEHDSGWVGEAVLGESGFLAFDFNRSPQTGDWENSA
jgi:hypothetical protein